MAYTDSIGYAAILAVVEATEGVQQSWFGSVDPRGFTAQSYPLVWLKPLGWEQLEDSDPPEPLRTVHFELIVLAPGKGGLEGFEAIEAVVDRLVEQLQDQGYGGTIPGLSGLSRCVVGTSHQVEGHALAGRFAYLRDDPADWDQPRA